MASTFFKILMLLALTAACIAQTPLPAPTISPSATPIKPPTAAPPTPSTPSPSPSPVTVAPITPSPTLPSPSADAPAPGPAPPSDNGVSRVAIGGTAFAASLIALAFM